MRHLNYNHLLYFWTVAREGSVAEAAQALHLTPQTVSGQLRLLADDIGQPLFRKVGRGLELTPVGRLVLRYADTIFSTGAELTERLRSGDILAASRLRIGVVNSLAKLSVVHLIAPAMSQDPPLRVSCREGDLERLLADLALHRLDVILSDRPVPSSIGIRAEAHALGGGPIGWFRSRLLDPTPYGDFPDCLAHAPLALPLAQHPLRRAIDQWLDARGWDVDVQAEFDDSALLKAFARTAPVMFPAPSALAEEVASMYDAVWVGETSELREECFALTVEREVSHPLLKSLFANS